MRKKECADAIFRLIVERVDEEGFISRNDVSTEFDGIAISCKPFMFSLDGVMQVLINSGRISPSIRISGNKIVELGYMIDPLRMLLEKKEEDDPRP